MIILYFRIGVIEYSYGGEMLAPGVWTVSAPGAYIGSLGVRENGITRIILHSEFKSVNTWFIIIYVFALICCINYILAIGQCTYYKLCLTRHCRLRVATSAGETDVWVHPC